MKKINKILMALISSGSLSVLPILASDLIKADTSSSQENSKKSAFVELLSASPTISNGLNINFIVGGNPSADGSFGPSSSWGHKLVITNIATSNVQNIDLWSGNQLIEGLNSFQTPDNIFETGQQYSIKITYSTNANPDSETDFIDIDSNKPVPYFLDVKDVEIPTDPLEGIGKRGFSILIDPNGIDVNDFINNVFDELYIEFDDDTRYDIIGMQPTVTPEGYFQFDIPSSSTFFEANTVNEVYLVMDFNPNWIWNASAIKTPFYIETYEKHSSPKLLINDFSSPFNNDYQDFTSIEFSLNSTSTTSVNQKGLGEHPIAITDHWSKIEKVDFTLFKTSDGNELIRETTLTGQDLSNLDNADGNYDYNIDFTLQNLLAETDYELKATLEVVDEDSIFNNGGNIDFGSDYSWNFSTRTKIDRPELEMTITPPVPVGWEDKKTVTVSSSVIPKESQSFDPNTGQSETYESDYNDLDGLVLITQDILDGSINHYSIEPANNVEIILDPGSKYRFTLVAKAKEHINTLNGTNFYYVEEFIETEKKSSPKILQGSSSLTRISQNAFDISFEWDGYDYSKNLNKNLGHEGIYINDKNGNNLELDNYSVNQIGNVVTISIFDLDYLSLYELDIKLMHDERTQDNIYGPFTKLFDSNGENFKLETNKQEVILNSIDNADNYLTFDLTFDKPDQIENVEVILEWTKNGITETSIETLNVFPSANIQTFKIENLIEEQEYTIDINVNHKNRISGVTEKVNILSDWVFNTKINLNKYQDTLNPVVHVINDKIFEIEFELINTVGLKDGFFKFNIDNGSNVLIHREEIDIDQESLQMQRMKKGFFVEEGKNFTEYNIELEIFGYVNGVFTPFGAPIKLK